MTLKWLVLPTALYKSQSNIAKHLVESNYEVASLLSSRKDKFNVTQQEGTAERKRKLARMQKIRQLESHENMPVITVGSRLILLDSFSSSYG